MSTTVDAEADPQAYLLECVVERDAEIARLLQAIGAAVDELRSGSVEAAGLFLQTALHRWLG